MQFPAQWEKAKEIKYSQGFNKPSPRDFVGFGPLTEPEALAIYNFTLSHNFDLVIAYHTQGEEIYWNFQNINPPNGYEIGQQFANLSGYSLAEVPYNSSFAGYKDWFIQTYNKPGFTIEAGLGENPLPISQFDKIYKDNLGILLLKGVVLTYLSKIQIFLQFHIKIVRPIKLYQYLRENFHYVEDNTLHLHNR